MSAPITRFWMVKRIGEDQANVFLTLREAQEEARRQATQQDGQYGVFEVVDAYQRGNPPVSQVILKR